MYGSRTAVRIVARGERRSQLRILTLAPVVMSQMMNVLAGSRGERAAVLQPHDHALGRHNQIRITPGPERSKTRTDLLHYWRGALADWRNRHELGAHVPSTPSIWEHCRCGDLDGGVEGDRVWMTCTCGAVINRNADRD